VWTSFQQSAVYLCMRYVVKCAYKGTDFHGWQIQPNAFSVQEALENALSTFFRTKIEITGSSRTDTGVHAAEQFAHFDIDFEISDIKRTCHALNAILPLGIAVLGIFHVNDDFHTRFNATHRRYLYRINQVKNPFFIDSSYYFKLPLDLGKMNMASEILLKHTDFQCFSRVKTDVATFNCKIDLACWEMKDGFLLFHIRADRFLRGMVRAIVGTMIEVGTGKISLEDFEEILLSKNRSNAGMAVPPQGLTLVEVGYTHLFS